MTSEKRAGMLHLVRHLDPKAVDCSALRERRTAPFPPAPPFALSRTPEYLAHILRARLHTLFLQQPDTGRVLLRGAA